MRHIVLVPAVLVMFALLSLAPADIRVQAQSSPANPPAFEVASVKANKSGDLGMFFRNQPGGRFTATNLPLKEIIRAAYQIQPFQISGGPDWIGTERWDIVAKAESDVAPLGPPGGGPSPISLMLQTLLADRFKLKVHKETREMPVYALLLARADGKLGPKIERSTTDCAALRGRGPAAGAAPPGPPAPPRPGDRPPCGMFMGPGSIGAGSTTMKQLATLLAQRVGRTVIDKTGLDGNWSFDFEFAPELPPGLAGPGGGAAPLINGAAPDPNAPSIYTALQEQLGLKLESQRGPVEMIVIDNVDRPTED